MYAAVFFDLGGTSLTHGSFTSIFGWAKAKATALKPEGFLEFYEHYMKTSGL
jgi:hypothetical protein